MVVLFFLLKIVKMRVLNQIIFIDVLLRCVVSRVSFNKRHLIMLIKFKFLTINCLSADSKLRIVAWWFIFYLCVLIGVEPLVMIIWVLRTDLLFIVFKRLMFSCYLFYTQWILIKVSWLVPLHIIIFSVVWRRHFHKIWILKMIN